MNVAGYVRVSTEDQVNGGYSIDAQIDKIKSYSSTYDLNLVEVVIDAGESAKSLKRTGLTKVLHMLDSGEADGILIFKLDRLTRSVSDLNVLLETYFSDKAGKSLLSVSDQIDTRTAAGRLVLNVLMSVSQWEREAIGERTKTALRFKQSQGEHIGSKPFGSTIIDKVLSPIESEQKIIQAKIAQRAKNV